MCEHGKVYCDECGIAPITGTPVKLIPTKPDTELAAELKAELIEAAEGWLEVCTKAHKAGFIVNARFGPNYLGTYIIQTMTLVKTF